MSELFPGLPQNYHKRKAAIEAKVRADQQLALIPQAEQMQRAAFLLVELLSDSDTTPKGPSTKKGLDLGDSVTIVERGYTAPELQGFLRRQKDPQPTILSEKKGWVVSKSKTYVESRAITLTEDGDLVLTREPDRAAGNATSLGVIDLSRYPFHDAFEKPRDYAETYGHSADLVNKGFLTFGSKEAAVSINLEYIARDMNAVYSDYMSKRTT